MHKNDLIHFLKDGCNPTSIIIFNFGGASIIFANCIKPKLLEEVSCKAKHWIAIK